ncbi:UDP-N-acetylglucosamine 2-epimerase (non-hydrolyzing) [candidate division KSB1 bacterium]|nr:UDP-N-acetylglucosamine 2-epimerase (non-hydrolyzing) [candidate division KSB1 bacterium]
MPDRIMIIFGTRPEAIKMAPVVKELQKRPGAQLILVSTSQHREMLRQVLELFEIEPDADLDIMAPDQSLLHIVEKAMAGFAGVIDRSKPDLILVQGDTTSAFAGALAGFYNQIEVGHVEAGLRTFNMQSPFPEEANRCLISRLAQYHFAPTARNRDNLLREGVRDERIAVTGNTVIDALYYVVKKGSHSDWVNRLAQDGRRLILVTAHRRENFGEPLRKICRALAQIVQRFPDVELVYPVHLNRNVQETVYPMLSKQERIHLMEPVDYQDLCALMQKSYLVLTDSGGIQEEAPALGKPVVVLRTETERPEAVEAGTVVVTGYETDALLARVEELLTDSAAYEKMARAVNPYGDGHAAERIGDFLFK